MKNFRLNRRHFLRGTGVAMGLPLLEAMLPDKAYAASPARMIGYFCPNGMHMSSWTPKSTGTNYTLSETLKPLEGVKSDLLVLSKMQNNVKKAGGGDHATGTASFLTNRSINKSGSNIRNGVSVDQFYAQKIKGQTKLESFPLGMDGNSGFCPNGFSCDYGRNISWANEKTVVPKINDARKAFDRLFAGFDNNDLSTTEAARRAAVNKSILDYVLEDSKALKSKLGQLDREKVDQYLTSIEALEQDIETPAVACEKPNQPGANLANTNKVRAFSDLMVVAFECDITRVSTFMMGNAVSGRNFGFIGASGGHHSTSHHQGNSSNHNKLKKINLWEIEQFAYLLNKLKSTVDVTGQNLLDSSTVFLSSDISDGDKHNHDNMPVLLAGKANGYFNTGRHINLNGRSFGDLFMTMLDAVGSPVSGFGDNGKKLISELT